LVERHGRKNPRLLDRSSKFAAFHLLGMMFESIDYFEWKIEISFVKSGISAPSCGAL